MPRKSNGTLMHEYYDESPTALQILIKHLF